MPNVAAIPMLADGLPISNLLLCVRATFVPALYKITQSVVASNLLVVKFGSETKNDFVVSIPIVVTPDDIINPLSIVIGPLAFLFVRLSTLILPTEPPPIKPSGLKPKTSGIKSSPSDIIKSALLPTLMSAYCVYAADADAGVSTVTVLSIGKTVFV